MINYKSVIIYYFLFFCILSIKELRSEWIDMTPKNMNLKETIFDVSFIDEDTGYAVGWSSSRSIILKTTNGGKSWDIKEFKGFYFFSVQASYSEIFIVGYSARCMCGVLFYSTNNGEDWNFYEFDGENKPLTYGAMKIRQNKNSHYFIAGFNGAIFFSDDFGESWQYANTNNSSDIFRDIKFIDNSTMFSIAGKNSSLSDKIYISKNKGKNWSLFSNFENKQILISGFHFLNSNDGFIFGIENGQEAILYTNDGGKNWKNVFQGIVGEILIDGIFIDYQNGLTARKNGAILRTTDAGKNWFESHLPTSKIIRGFVKCCEESNKFVIAYGNDGTLFKFQIMNSIDEISRNANVFIAPNPVSEYLLIEIMEPMTFSRLEIINIMGEKVLTFSNVDQKNLINVENFSKGVYFVVIYSTYGDVRIYKFQKSS